MRQKEGKAVEGGRGVHRLGYKKEKEDERVQRRRWVGTKENEENCAEVRGGKRERGWGEWAFVGVDVMAFVGHVSLGCQGAPVCRYGGGGRTRSAAAEEEDGAKTCSETNPSLPLPPSSFSHTDKLSQIPVTRSPADWSRSPIRQLT